MKKCFLVDAMLQTACAPAQDITRQKIADANNWANISKRDQRSAVLTTPWQVVLASVTESSYLCWLWKNLRARKANIKSDAPKKLSVKTPDGANIDVYHNDHY